MDCEKQKGNDPNPAKVDVWEERLQRTGSPRASGQNLCCLRLLYILGSPSEPGEWLDGPFWASGRWRNNPDIPQGCRCAR